MAQRGKRQAGNFDPEKIIDSIEKLAYTNFNPVEFWKTILAAKCSLGQANAAAILRCNNDGAIDVLIFQPDVEKSSGPPPWLQRCAEIIRENHPIGKRVVMELPDSQTAGKEKTTSSILIIPHSAASTSIAYEVFLLSGANPQLLEANRWRLELLDSFSDILQKGPVAGKINESLQKLKQSMQVLSVVNGQESFHRAAMAFCNEVASQWKCERVSTGFIEGKYVKLKAMSHTENFIRKMQMIQDIESTMEECVDQDMEVLYPAPENWSYINRAAASLSKRQGPTNILSLPLRTNGKVRGALTLERPPDKAFSVAEIETIRLVCELCSARLTDMYRNTRRLALTLTEKWNSLRDSLLAPRHSGLKSAAVAGFLGLLIITFGKGVYKAEAPFIIEAVLQQVVPAPFEGFIKEVDVEVGDTVEAGETVLGSLDTAELRLQLAQVIADKVAYLKQAAAAMRDGEAAQAQIAQANADKAEAQERLLNYKISQAHLTSPVTGKVVKGDLKKQIGAPVQTGDVLFEVTPIESLRAELMIPEDQIFDIEVGQKGYLATFSYPSRRIGFKVERINPVAEVVNQRNIFKVRAHLDETPSWMRPGMEGVAKVHAGRRPFIWLWTRKIVNWLRMKLWI